MLILTTCRPGGARASRKLYHFQTANACWQKKRRGDTHILHIEVANTQWDYVSSVCVCWGRKMLNAFPARGGPVYISAENNKLN